MGLIQRINAKAAKYFLKQALAFCHAIKPRTITCDGDKAYPVAIWKLKMGKHLSRYTSRCVKKYLNNMIEQDHRFIKKRIIIVKQLEK
ncbi:DDE domain-containing protein (plasmid) [Bacillus mycoides]|nr:DDE domain-containing protein [Bacillus mycoides]